MLTTRQKALLLGSPALVGLLVCLGWAAVDAVLNKAYGCRPPT